MRLIASGRIIEGKLQMINKKQFINDLAFFEGKTVIVTIEKKRKTRSLAQNQYYWGVVVQMVKDGLRDMGYKLTTEQTHEYLKSTFNLIEIVNDQTGEILKSVGSTTQMSTSQMMDYFSDIYHWAAEYLNIHIPEPNEQLQLI